MKKSILILSFLFFLSCKKDCYLMSSAGTMIELTSSVRAAYKQYLAIGYVSINGNIYNKTGNSLHKTCN